MCPATMVGVAFVLGGDRFRQTCGSRWRCVPYVVTYWPDEKNKDRVDTQYFAVGVITVWLASSHPHIQAGEGELRMVGDG